MVKQKKRPRNKGEKEKGKGQRQKTEKGGGGKEEHIKTEILKTSEIPKIGDEKEGGREKTVQKKRRTRSVGDRGKQA